jgi:hypothetical protein
LFDKNSLWDELGIPKKELYVKKKNSQDVTLQLRVVRRMEGAGVSPETRETRQGT